MHNQPINGPDLHALDMLQDAVAAHCNPFAGPPLGRATWLDWETYRTVMRAKDKRRYIHYET
jgi:hypothetical protein